MVKLSIIVPVYNVEKYLKRCVESIFAQTFENFELILVDDGSTDQSGKICDQFALSDQRVKVIHQKNSGPSCARNTGIQTASGDYVGFVDGDDFIQNDMYQVLVQNLEKHQADVSICGSYNCYTNNKYPLCEKKEFLILNNEQALKTAMEGLKFSVSPCDKIFRKTMFDNIVFPMGKFSEDAAIIPSILSQAEVVVATTEPKYNYVHRKESTTTSRFKPRDLDVLDAYQKNYDLIKQKFPYLLKFAQFRILWANMYLLDKMVVDDQKKYPKEYKMVSNTLKKNIFKILFNNIFSVKRKIAMIVFCFSEKTYVNLVLKNNDDRMKLFE